MPTDPVDCDVVDIDAGKAAYTGGACVACHQGFDEVSGTAPGLAPVFPGIDVNNFTKFDESMVSLNKYLATQMMTGKGMGCAAGDSDCEQKADNIAAYLKKYSNTPWCESVASSSSMSSEMSSASMSSSSMPAATNDATVQFVYPTQKAHLGGATSVKVALKVISTKVVGAVESVTINGMALADDGMGMWEADSLAVAASLDNQEFKVVVRVAGENAEANSLFLSNLGNQQAPKAGENRVYSIRSVAFDTDDEVLYYSDPYGAQLYKYNNITGESESLYTGMISDQQSDDLNWSIGVDSANDTVYLAADAYSFGEVGTNKYSVSLVKVDSTGETVTPEADGFLTSAKGLVVDIEGAALTSLNGTTPEASIYTMDFGGTDTFQRWGIDGVGPYLAGKPSYSDANADSTLSSTLGLSAFTGHIDGENSKFLFARAYKTIEKRGFASLVELTSVKVGGRPRSTAKELTLLEGISPTALLYTKDGSGVYIADQSRVWLMDLSDYSKVLVTSSNGADIEKGTGPSISSSVSGMALHPSLNYLYLAVDTYGLIMVDLDTGNRILIVR